MQPDDGRPHPASPAGHRLSARDRHRCGVPAGVDVRSGRGLRERHVRTSRRERRVFCSTPAWRGRNIGRKHAMELLLTGQLINAATAPAWGW